MITLGLWLAAGVAGISTPALVRLPHAAFVSAAASPRPSVLHETNVERQKSHDTEEKCYDEGVEGDPQTRLSNRNFVGPVRSVTAESICIGVLTAFASIVISLSGLCYARANGRVGRLLSIGLFVCGNALVFMILHTATNLGNR